MRNDEQWTEELHEHTIAQLLVHLQSLRQTVPVNYELKDDLRNKLLERMKQLGVDQAGQMSRHMSRKLRRFWGVSSAILLFVIVSVAGYWWNETIHLTKANIVTLSQQAFPESVALSPKGDRIALLASGNKLVIRAVDGKQKDVFYHLPAPNGKYQGVQWANNARQIAVSESDQHASRVWIVDIDSERSDSSSRLLREERQATFGELSWSPDNSRLAFTRKANGKTEIWLNSTVSLEEQKLTDGSQPAWSPDGEYIGFHREGTIYVLRLDNGEIHEVGKGDYPSWKSDNELTFTAASGRLAAVTMPQINDRIAYLSLPLSEDAKLLFAKWSEDGKHVLIASQANQNITYSIAEKK